MSERVRGISVISGSVALLADTIHNIADATTAIPLWIAFLLAPRKPTLTFTYGYGRVEDLAEILLGSSSSAPSSRATPPLTGSFIRRPSRRSGVIAAGVLGFVGNEAVAVFRIRVGWQMNSAALIADGYHARTEGLTSLAVVLGVLGVWLGFPLADPIVGLLITVAIFLIVWQSARSVLTRMLDGVEPGIVEEIRHAAEHVPGIASVLDVKGRWLGHKLHADVIIAVDDRLALAEANRISARLQRELHAHLPALAAANVRFGIPSGEPAWASEVAGGPGHHAPEAFRFRSKLADGVLEIVNTPDGERMRLTVSRHEDGLTATVLINRPGGEIETLSLACVLGDHDFQSSVAPAAALEFSAELHLFAAGRTDVLPFH